MNQKPDSLDLGGCKSRHLQHTNEHYFLGSMTFIICFTGYAGFVPCHVSVMVKHANSYISANVTLIFVQ